MLVNVSRLIMLVIPAFKAIQLFPVDTKERLARLFMVVNTSSYHRTWIIFQNQRSTLASRSSTTQGWVTTIPYYGLNHISRNSAFSRPFQNLKMANLTAKQMPSFSTHIRVTISCLLQQGHWPGWELYVRILSPSSNLLLSHPKFCTRKMRMIPTVRRLRWGLNSSGRHRLASVTSPNSRCRGSNKDLYSPSINVPCWNLFP